MWRVTKVISISRHRQRSRAY